jgi:hypothetical protein
MRPPCHSLCSIHARTHAHARTHTHAQTHTLPHTHRHAAFSMQYFVCTFMHIHVSKVRVILVRCSYFRSYNFMPLKRLYQRFEKKNALISVIAHVGLAGVSTQTSLVRGCWNAASNWALAHPPSPSSCLYISECVRAPRRTYDESN